MGMSVAGFVLSATTIVLLSTDAVLSASNAVRMETLIYGGATSKGLRPNNAAGVLCRQVMSKTTRSDWFGTLLRRTVLRQDGLSTDRNSNTLASAA